MKKHKWKPEFHTITVARDECINCGIYREWIGAEYQAYRYLWHSGGSLNKSFRRPDCKQKKS